MNLTDTHTHLYVEEFDLDRSQVISNAIKNGVTRMLLPNIDSTTREAMLQLVTNYPSNCFPMMGLHPTSVNKNFEKELELVHKELSKPGKYFGVGEIGIDLYWEKTYREQQIESFRRQLQLAKQYKLPVSIHTRDAFDITLQTVKEELTDDLTGVFHCFTGNVEQANKIIDIGFKLGIGGIVTFKNAGLDKVVKKLPLETLVLETDSPYLTPSPYRGKRNQSAYLVYIADKIAEIFNVKKEKVAEITQQNVDNLFFKIIGH